MEAHELHLGERVRIRWGNHHIEGLVDVVYGAPDHPRVRVRLTPEVSGLDVVDKETTVTFRLERVEKASAA